MSWWWLLACAGDPAPLPIDAWVDSSGRQVMYRGMNLNNGAKDTSDHLPGLTDSELDLLVEHGVSLARYLVFWEALEPEQGTYDQDYMARVVVDVARLTSRGLDVVLDMHQDVYGQGFGFTGLPDWTCDAELYETFEYQDLGWWANYMTPEVRECFDRFWASSELQLAYAQAWGEMAERAKEDPGVIGFEVMNEPFWGTLDPVDLDTEYLPAFYETVADHLPQDRVVIVDPCVSTNLSGEVNLELPEDDRWVLG
ncbi:MAG: cellulase family glycosylhydrolase, partial [Myxococcota bacterium]|nr:cellulase family glycosylhydrolase [Myxococcota bacterium]